MNSIEQNKNGKLKKIGNKRKDIFVSLKIFWGISFENVFAGNG